MIKISISSVLVDDQDKALEFYTEVMGFVKKSDIPIGEFKWLTVTSSEGENNNELLLEPMSFPPAKTYQKALFEAGIPLTAFATDDILVEYKRLKALGVTFRGEPQEMGSITSVLFEDTCGNLINLFQTI